MFKLAFTNLKNTVIMMKITGLLSCFTMVSAFIMFIFPAESKSFFYRSTFSGIYSVQSPLEYLITFFLPLFILFNWYVGRYLYLTKFENLEHKEN